CSSSWPSLVVAVATIGCSSISSARGAEPQWLTLMPMGVSMGTTLDVTLGGPPAREARELFFSFPGPRADRRSAGVFAVSVAVAKDAVSARREGEVWALAAQGLSNPCRIVVDDLPQVREQEQGDASAPAQVVTLPVVIDGTIDPATDRDEYR